MALSIAVMYYAQHSAVFFNIKVQIAFLVLSCTFNLLFTFLISIRLLSVRKQIIDTLGAEHAKTYTSVTATLVESAALYFVFDVIFVFAFGLKSNVQNLILLEYSSIQVGVHSWVFALPLYLLWGIMLMLMGCGIRQGIAELLIIVRVARGQDYDSTVTTSPTKLSRMDFRRNATSERGDTGVGIGFGGRPTQTTTGHGEDVQEQVRARVVSLELRRGGSDSEKDKEKDGAKDAAKQVITKDFV
ncbi:hypothetical protein VNI00_012254 [Paramarasmius palmivorus]|uniref:Uncharacterized protein n=1 Tax=Paramarasmius palmivorus TaxID=297713 RepID=A0AAW0C5E2_9AGAR